MRSNSVALKRQTPSISMPNDRLIELIGAALLALLGGGQVWQWLTNKKKSSVEAEVLATKSAIDAMVQTVEFLKKRVKELDDENCRLRVAMETERLENQASVKKAVERMNFFQGELATLQAENVQLKQKLGHLSGSEMSGAQMAELALLRAEVQQLRTENAILKNQLEELKERIDGNSHA